MNRKDGGRGREDEGGSPQLEPGRKLPGTGEGRRQARLEARRNGGQGGGRQCWRQGGTGARRNGARRNGARRRRFSEFFGVKREKKRDNCLISNKNH